MHIMVCYIIEICHRLLVRNGSLSLDPKLGTFSVLGSLGKLRLFPSEYCSCPSTSTCYHILGVQLSLGILPKKIQRMSTLHSYVGTHEAKVKRNVAEKDLDQVLMKILHFLI